MKLAPSVALAALFALPSVSAASPTPPAARVVGHAVVVDALERSDGVTLSLGDDGLIVAWDDRIPLAWRVVPGAMRLVDGPDGLIAVTDTATVPLDEHLAPGTPTAHSAAVTCPGAAPVWVRREAGWQVLDVTGTSAPIDATVDAPRCSLLDDSRWLSGFDGVDAIAIGDTPQGPVITRIPWDSGEPPVVVAVESEPALVLGEDRAVSARTGTALTPAGAVRIGWCADRSAHPTAPCHEPRVAVDVPAPIPRTPIGVVADGRSVTVVDAHGWLHVTANPARTALRTRSVTRPDAFVAGADATHGVALVCETTGVDSRWTLQALASGEAVALADVPGACVPDAAAMSGAVVGRTDRALVEIAGPRSLRFTTAEALGLGTRALLGATPPLGRDERRLVLTRRFDAACPSERIELVRAAPDARATVVADLGCAADARLGELRTADDAAGVVVDLIDGPRRIAIGLRFDGQIAALVPVPADAIRVTRMWTRPDGAALDDVGAGRRHSASGEDPLVVTRDAHGEVVVDAWGLIVRHDGHTLRLQRAGDQVLIDDGHGFVSTRGWADRVVATGTADTNLALAEAWFGPAAQDAAGARPRPVLDRFRAWGEQIRDRRASRRNSPHPTGD